MLTWVRTGLTIGFAAVAGVCAENAAWIGVGMFSIAAFMGLGVLLIDYARDRLA